MLKEIKAKLTKKEKAQAAAIKEKSQAPPVEEKELSVEEKAQEVFVDEVPVKEEVSITLTPAITLPVIDQKEKSEEKEKLIEKLKKKLQDGTITDGEAAQLQVWLAS